MTAREEGARQPRAGPRWTALGTYLIPNTGWGIARKSWLLGFKHFNIHWRGGHLEALPPLKGALEQ